MIFSGRFQPVDELLENYRYFGGLFSVDAVARSREINPPGRGHLGLDQGQVLFEQAAAKGRVGLEQEQGAADILEDFREINSPKRFAAILDHSQKIRV